PSEEIRQLRSRGAMIHLSHDAAHLRAARPVLVVYSSAVRSNNPELLAARELKVPITRRATLLAALAQRQRPICVAGMHGKTTTSALLSFALDRLAARPSYAIGALVPQLECHARFVPRSAAGAPEQPAPGCSGAEGPHVPDRFPSRERSGSPPGATAPTREQAAYFVVEADESDGTLLEFRPEHAIVLNVDAEHLDYYANLE